MLRVSVPNWMSSESKSSSPLKIPRVASLSFKDERPKTRSLSRVLLWLCRRGRDFLFLEKIHFSSHEFIQFLMKPSRKCECILHVVESLTSQGLKSLLLFVTPLSFSNSFKYSFLSLAIVSNSSFSSLIMSSICCSSLIVSSIC